jgi:hypothetical protein
MRLRILLAGIVAVGFLSVVPARAQAQVPPGPGAYDPHHHWHDSAWWRQHDPDWVHKNHPDWYGPGDWDKHHHWHDRSWWEAHDSTWAHKHHPDWY